MSNTPQNPLMAMAQQSFQNPNAQAVPQAPQGQIDPAQHPVVGAIIRALSQGMQSYGMTAMDPRERMQRQEMDAQKSETMARLAQTGAYQQGELEYRGKMADTGAARERDYAADVASKTEARKFKQEFEQNVESRKAANAQTSLAIQQGRLDLANQGLEERVKQFEKNYALAGEKLKNEEVRTAILQEGMGIRQQIANYVGQALNQKGTTEGMKAQMFLRQMQLAHPLQSLAPEVFGGMDLGSMVSGAEGVGPKLSGLGPSAAPATGQPAAAAAPTAAAPIVPGKLVGKARQKGAANQSGGLPPGWKP